MRPRDLVATSDTSNSEQLPEHQQAFTDTSDPLNTNNSEYESDMSNSSSTMPTTSTGKKGLSGGGGGSGGGSGGIGVNARQNIRPSSRLSIPSGNVGSISGGRGSASSSYGGMSAMSYDPQQYLHRILDFQQMDVQSALDQMRTLCTLQPQRVYKTSYYRKQTKDHWSRDDPAFAILQIGFLAVASLAYCIAFRVSGNMLYGTLRFAFNNIIINYLLSGVVISTICRSIANTYLTHQHPRNSNSHVVRQGVEWLYAFDIHCNAFFPFFVLIYCAQFFLLPIVLQRGLVSLIVSNTLYALAFGWYFYITHLGYRALPFLSGTEVFLFPVAGVAAIYVLNFIGFPFGLGFNASRLVAHLYFD